MVSGDSRSAMLSLGDFFSTSILWRICSACKIEELTVSNRYMYCILVLSSKIAILLTVSDCRIDLLYAQQCLIVSAYLYMEGEQQTQVLGSAGVRAISCEIVLHDKEEYHKKYTCVD